MNSPDRHKRYVEDLLKLAKDSKEEVRKTALNRLSFLASKAGGNPYLFQRLITATRKNMLRLLAPLAMKYKQEAERFGKGFGADRRAKGTSVIG